MVNVEGSKKSMAAHAKFTVPTRLGDGNRNSKTQETWLALPRTTHVILGGNWELCWAGVIKTYEADERTWKHVTVSRNADSDALHVPRCAGLSNHLTRPPNGKPVFVGYRVWKQQERGEWEWRGEREGERVGSSDTTEENNSSSNRKRRRRIRTRQKSTSASPVMKDGKINVRFCLEPRG
ncbi:hypothetical protein IAQ61_000398 [Plenodomus lingam]|uniref:uncharacterized protein n=1 Tax=Leptosphaeria maculans TaxID=5022 RepID=UPI00331BA085|nr:hypothetical protein IAQ61_000398 [Plenodomus lingam]